MIDTIVIWIRGYPNEDRVRAHLRKAGIDEGEGYFTPSGPGTVGWQGVLPADDNRWQVLQKLSRSTRVPPTVVQHTHATEEELDTAELLLVLRTPELLAKGDVGPDFDSEFDYEGACPVCLSGAKILPPLRISSRALPKRRLIAATHGDDLLVTGELAEALRGVAGSEQWLMPVEDRKSRELLPWVSLQAVVTLPPVDRATSGFVQYRDPTPGGGCKACGQDCWSGVPPIERRDGVEVIVPKRLVYSAESVNPLRGGADCALPALMFTWERCGPGTRPGISAHRQVARPYHVVGQEVASVLRQHVSKYVSLHPIEIR